MTQSRHTFHTDVRNFISFYQKHPEVKGKEIFEHCFFYAAYTDNFTFFLKDAQSIENLVELFNTSLSWGLNPNLTKCKISGIRALKGVV